MRFSSPPSPLTRRQPPTTFNGLPSSSTFEPPQSSLSFQRTRHSHPLSSPRSFGVVRFQTLASAVSSPVLDAATHPLSSASSGCDARKCLWPKKTSFSIPEVLTMSIHSIQKMISKCAQWHTVEKGAGHNQEICCLHDQFSLLQTLCDQGIVLEFEHTSIDAKLHANLKSRVVCSTTPAQCLC